MWVLSGWPDISHLRTPSPTFPPPPPPINFVGFFKKLFREKCPLFLPLLSLRTGKEKVDFKPSQQEEIDCIKEGSPLWEREGGEKGLFSNKIDHLLIDLTACRQTLCQSGGETGCPEGGLEHFHLSTKAHSVWDGYNYIYCMIANYFIISE